MAKKRSLMTNGDAIRKARLKKNLSVEELADLTDYEPKTIKKAEAGGPVEEKTLIAIAKHLVVDFAVLEASGVIEQLAVTASGQSHEKRTDVTEAIEVTTKLAEGITWQNAIEQVLHRLHVDGRIKSTDLIRITVTRGQNET